MKFTSQCYPKYVVRLKSGQLAYCRDIATGEKAVFFFRTKRLARGWLKYQFRNQEHHARIIELDEQKWWHMLLESPRREYMALALGTETGTAIMNTTQALYTVVEFLSPEGKELTESDLDAAMHSDSMDLIHAEIAAENNPTLQKVLAEIRERVASSGTVTPTLFFVNRDSQITYHECVNFNELEKNRMADLLVNLVREGNLAVGFAAAARTVGDVGADGSVGTTFVEHPGASDVLQVFYEELGLEVFCRAQIQRESEPALSDWDILRARPSTPGRFQNIFAKALALGPSPATRDDLAAEMRRDLACLARSKGITEPITFEELTSHCRLSEIERLVRKWHWQLTFLPDSPSRIDTSDMEQVANLLPWKFWDGTIDPSVS